MLNLMKAFLIALKAHKGQVDKAGKPYIFHPIHVAVRVRGIKAKEVALLHDVLEDNKNFNISDFRFLDKEQQEALSLLTHDKEQTYFEYIEQVKTNKIAKLVKKADLKHNLDISRLKNITQKDLERKEKYELALQKLKL